MYGWMNGIEWMDGWMDGWVDGMDGWLDGWLAVWMHGLDWIVLD